MGGHIHGVSGHDGAPGDRPSRCEVPQHCASVGIQADDHTVLGADQQAISDCFAHAPVSPGREAFCGAAWQPGPNGLPLIEGSIATLECTVTQTFSAGDHDLFIGRVDTLASDPGHPMPLLYYRRRYLSIERAATAEVEGKPER